MEAFNRPGAPPQIGDEVIAVDGRRVRGLDLEFVKRLTVGLEYTLCSLEMARAGQLYNVTLQVRALFSQGGISQQRFSSLGGDSLLILQ
jgi:hypothetical protein